MEDKLLTLKTQFCNWYCSGRDGFYNPDCDKICDWYNPIDVCDLCKIEEYIKFIRDELGVN
jgi:hypothetical protein